MKKWIALLLALLMVFSLAACGGGDKDAEPSAPAQTSGTDAGDQSGDANGTNDADEPYEIVYLCPSFGVEWCVNVKESLEMFEDDYNIKVLSAESSNSNDTYLTLVETYCGQGVDGFILMCYNEIAERVIETIREYNIPVIFDSIKLTDTDGNLLCSGVELNGYDCGYQCGQWLAENYKSYFGEDVDINKVGLMVVTMSSVTNLTARADGVKDAFAKYLPDCPNVFEADLVAQGEGNSTSAYNEVAPKLSANPDIEYWLIAGIQDTYGQGAARAVESLGLDDKALVVSAGGENLVPEWEVGYEGCWVACNFFEAYNYAEQFVPAIVDLIEGNITEKDLWPEWKEGDTYSSYQISGVMATKDTYKDIVAPKG